MKLAFGSKDTADVAAEEPTSSALTEKPSKTLAAPQSAPTDDLGGEISRGDVRLPRLNLVARTGNLAETFTPGGFVLNKEALLSDGKTPLIVVAVRLKKEYQEMLEYGDEATPRTFKTAAEVEEAGGELTWKRGENCFGEIAHIELLIEQPDSLEEDAEALFFFNGGEKNYAHCIFTVTSTAYTAIAKTLISARMNHLRDTGLVGGKWELTSKLMKNAKNAWYTPQIKSAGRTDTVFREATADLL